MPMPDLDDDSIEAHRTRSLILAAADSTIEQTIRLRTNLLTPSAADADMEKIFEERRAAAELGTSSQRMSPLPCQARAFTCCSHTLHCIAIIRHVNVRVLHRFGQP
jgi:hypothetical protein